jgi:hypothetical protein
MADEETPAREVSERCKAAVAAYGKVLDLERQIDQARLEHQAAVLLIPTEDLAEYYTRTQELRDARVIEPTTVTPPPPSPARRRAPKRDESQ